MYWSMMKWVLSFRIKLRSKIKIKIKLMSRERMLDWPQQATNGMGPSPKPHSISHPDRGRQPNDVLGPVALRIYKRRKRAGGTDGEVHCDITFSPTSLYEPITKAQRRWESSTPRCHCSGSPALTEFDVVHLPLADASQIYFHFTNKNLYVGSNDIELIGQALWWDTLTLKE
jgi:hypothetical protein